MSNHCKSIITAKPLHFSKRLTPKQVFLPFAYQAWAMWLDSSNSEHVDSRHDIMVWQPMQTLVTVSNNTTVTSHFDDKNEANKTQSAECPFTLMDQALLAFKQTYEIDETSLPFIGGALGYFSYDLGRRLETLPEQANKDINLPEMAIGIYSQAIIYDRLSQAYFLICQENKRAALEQDLIALISAQAALLESFSLTAHWQSNLSKAQYQEKFDQVQAYLLSGDCYQINLTQRFAANYQGDEYLAYLALRESNKAPFSAFMRFEHEAILSISPERFIKLSQNKVQTKPIKGTIARSDDKAIDLQHIEQLKNSTKDRAENLMIVDLLRNDISRVCKPGSVKVPSLFAVESFPAVHHLVSTVEGELANNKSASELLRACFPGGSITGAPKIRAMEIIDELEPQRRSIYCGSIGYISACGNMDSSITIRTLACKNNTIYCWAGGGIVADSNVDSEYQESFDKVNKILPVLNQNQLTQIDLLGEK